MMLIGEVSHRTGVSARMLRHYESLGLLTPEERTSGGYRDYGEQDLQRIFYIETLRSLNLSLPEVAAALEDPLFSPEEVITELIKQTRERLRNDRELLKRLQDVASTTPQTWDDVPRVIELLQALRSPDPGQRQRAGLLATDIAASPAAALARSALLEEDLNIAGTLRWAVLDAGEEAVAIVAQGMSSPHPAVRQRAIRILAKSPGDTHREKLSQALTDEDTTVQEIAALALGNHGYREAIPTLLEIVAHGTSDIAAGEALGIIVVAHPSSGQDILAAITEALSTPNATNQERLRLTQVLAELPADDVTSLLRTLHDDEDRAVQLTAMSIMRQHPDYHENQ